MMHWKKKGFLYGAGVFDDIKWHKKYTMTPLPYLKDKETLRIYLTMCDESNVGRVGYIDVNPDNPAEIKSYSEKPVLDVGERGHFDEHGVIPTSLLREGDDLYLFYSAYQRLVGVPYAILSGLAVSKDNGDTFQKITKEVPLLERMEGEVFQRSAIEVMKQKDTYKMWYTGGLGWINNGVHEAPRYDLKYMETKNLLSWNGKPKTAMNLKDDDEYGLTMPQVFFEEGLYKMIYSVRSISKGYRIGYAESEDGIHFTRMDDKMVFEEANTQFDSEMMCFGKIYAHKDKVYMFYCGNRYGLGGMGYAELEGSKIG